MATRSAAKRARRNARAAKARRTANPHIHALPHRVVVERAEHARSGAAGAHRDRRDVRARTRQAALRRALNEWV